MSWKAGRPKTLTAFLSTICFPAKICNRVVFPAPFAPMSRHLDPGGNLRVKSLMIGWYPGYAYVKELTSIASFPSASCSIHNTVSQFQIKLEVSDCAHSFQVLPDVPILVRILPVNACSMDAETCKKGTIGHAILTPKIQLQGGDCGECSKKFTNNSQRDGWYSWASIKLFDSWQTSWFDREYFVRLWKMARDSRAILINDSIPWNWLAC